MEDIQRESSLGLTKEQMVCFEEGVGVLKKFHGVFNSSQMGAGKSHFAMAMSLRFGLPIIYIAPLRSHIGFIEKCSVKGVKLQKVINYEKLRGTSRYPPANGLLMIRDDKYVPTEEFTELLKKGVLLVFDESHNIRNQNNQMKAAHCLVKELVRVNSKSRIIMLSGTQGHTNKNISSILMILGLVTEDSLISYDPSRSEWIPTGIKQVYSLCEKYNPDLVRNIKKKYIIDDKTVHDICAELYDKVIRDLISCRMPCKVEIDAKNGYYKMPDRDTDMLRKATGLISRTIVYDNHKNTYKSKTGSWGDVIRGLIMNERSKLYTMIRLAKQTLDNIENSKVVICLSYIEAGHFDIACEALREYNPLIINGRKKQRENERSRKLFQEANLNYRVVIINPQSAESFDLDDQDGRFPRYLFMIANFMFSNSRQTMGRIARLNTKSLATIRMVFNIDFPEETNIINSLSRNSSTAKIISGTNNVSDDLPYPTEFKNEYESNMPYYTELVRQLREIENGLISM